MDAVRLALEKNRGGANQLQVKNMKNTKIQWCDGTVSPVPTCDGCPLRQPDAAVEREIKDRLMMEGVSKERIAGAVQTYQLSTDNSRRKRILAAITSAIV